MTAYDTVRTWPPRLIYAAVSIQQQQEAARRVTALHDAALAAGLKLGRKWVDPTKARDDVDTSQPHYSIQPFLNHVQALERVAEPWRYTPGTLTQEREREEEAMFDRMFSAIRAIRS